jgi:hypothetical protein
MGRKAALVWKVLCVDALIKDGIQVFWDFPMGQRVTAMSKGKWMQSGERIQLTLQDIDCTRVEMIDLSVALASSLSQPWTVFPRNVEILIVGQDKSPDVIRTLAWGSMV